MLQYLHFSQEQGIFEKLIVNPGVSTFKGDVEFWGASVGAGKSAYWDKSTNSFNFINTSKLHFGNSRELTVYHNGFNGNSYIEESHSTGSLYIRSTDMYFENTGGVKKYAVFNDGDSVDLYHDNLRKFSTISVGATVFGTLYSQGSVIDGSLTVSGTSNLNGNVNLGNQLTDDIVFGGKVNSTVLPNTDSTYDLGSSALRWSTIYADNFDGIANLTLESLVVTGIATFKDDVEFHGKDGTKELYWDKNSSTKSYLRFLDGVKLTFGSDSVASEGLRIWNEASSSTVNTSYIDGSYTKGQFIIQGGEDGLFLQAKAGEGSVSCIPDGKVEIYYDNNLKFESTNDGVKITGGLQDKDGELGTLGQVLSSTGTGLDWVDAAVGSVTEVDVKQDNYCGVDDSSFNPITVTPTSVGVTTVSIATTSNAYGRKFIQVDDPTSPEGGSYTVCDGDIWYDTSS